MQELTIAKQEIDMGKEKEGRLGGEKWVDGEGGKGEKGRWLETKSEKVRMGQKGWEGNVTITKCTASFRKQLESVLNP